MRSLSRFNPLLTPFVVAAAIAGCADAPAERVGYVEVPLTAPGANGAIYHLPPGTSLQVTNPAFGGSFSLDGDGDVQTLVLPPGSYNLQLFDFAGDTTVWPLTRNNADGSVDTVPASLELTPSITVTEGQTSPLTIRFHVAIVGPITFARGTVDVTVQVVESAVGGFALDFAAPVLAVQSAQIGDTAPAELPARLPAPGDTGDTYHVSLQSAGDWTAMSPTGVCIPTTSTVTATGNQGFVSVVVEAPQQGGEQLCIQQIAPGFAFVTISYFRQGAAATSLLTDLGHAPYLVTHGVLASLNADLYDGRTLHLEALQGIHAAHMLIDGAIFGTVDSPFGPIFQSWYQLNESGEGTLLLTGR